MEGSQEKLWRHLKKVMKGSQESLGSHDGIPRMSWRDPKKSYGGISRKSLRDPKKVLEVMMGSREMSWRDPEKVIVVNKGSLVQSSLHKTNLFLLILALDNLTLFILKKTLMKCRFIWHLIRVCTVCYWIKQSSLVMTFSFWLLL